MQRGTVSDVVLTVLLQAIEREGAFSLPTQDVAQRANLPLQVVGQALPVLVQRGHLDPQCPDGSMRLSEAGVRAARALRER
ncbi:MAG: hypothetical protein ACM33T_00940 [Solirubrobacterales bacterium]